MSINVYQDSVETICDEFTGLEARKLPEFFSGAVESITGEIGLLPASLVSKP